MQVQLLNVFTGHTCTIGAALYNEYGEYWDYSPSGRYVVRLYTTDNLVYTYILFDTMTMTSRTITASINNKASTNARNTAPELLWFNEEKYLGIRRVHGLSYGDWLPFYDTIVPVQESPVPEHFTNKITIDEFMLLKKIADWQLKQLLVPAYKQAPYKLSAYERKVYNSFGQGHEQNNSAHMEVGNEIRNILHKMSVMSERPIVSNIWFSIKKLLTYLSIKES